MRHRKCRLAGRLIPERGFERQIAGNLIVQQRRIRGERREAVGNSRQHVVENNDAFRGVLRGGLSLGDHHGDRLTDESHPLSGEWQMQPLERRLTPRPCEGFDLHVMGAGRIGHVADAASARCRIVLRGEDGDDFGKVGRGPGVDRSDMRMGMGRPDECRIGLAVEDDIVGEAPAPGDKPLVLETRQRPADIRFAPSVLSHVHVPPRPIRRFRYSGSPAY